MEATQLASSMPFCILARVPIESVRQTNLVIAWGLTQFNISVIACMSMHIEDGVNCMKPESSFAS